LVYVPCRESIWVRGNTLPETIASRHTCTYNRVIRIGIALLDVTTSGYAAYLENVLLMDIFLSVRFLWAELV
jgi:hypothetical protein